MTALLLTIALTAPFASADDTIAPEIQQRVLLATVHIVDETAHADGSGVCVRRQGPYAYVLTAAHVTSEPNSLIVETFTGDAVLKPAAAFRSVTRLAVSNRPDLALLRVKVGEEKLAEPLPLCPLKEMPDTRDFLALLTGCLDGKPPCAREIKVAGRERIKRPDAVESVISWQMNYEPSPGQSGGPLVDQRGRVLGIVSGAGGGKGYATHLEEIRQFLDKIKDWPAEK